MSARSSQSGTMTCRGTYRLWSWSAETDVSYYGSSLAMASMRWFSPETGGARPRGPRLHRPSEPYTRALMAAAFELEALEQPTP
jgi:hypothetical protein